MEQTVAFIGIGIMGGRMAKNVLKAGHALRVYNRTAAKTEELQKLGATVAGSPREAAQGADAVITMVADPPALRAVLEGDEGALAGCHPGTLVIGMSTAAKALIEERRAESKFCLGNKPAGLSSESC